MKLEPQIQREFRVVAAGVFKATCLQLLDEVHENRNLSILITKRGKPVGQLMCPPEGIELTGPTVLSLQAQATANFEEHRKKKKDRKKKHK